MSKDTDRDNLQKLETLSQALNAANRLIFKQQPMKRSKFKSSLMTG